MRKLVLILACLTLAPAWSPPVAANEGLRALVDDLVADDEVPTGILYDRVVPLSGLEGFHGGPDARPTTVGSWRQAYSEIRRAGAEPAEGLGVSPSVPEVMERASRDAHRGVVPIAVMSFRYHRIAPDALETGALAVEDGRLVRGTGTPFVERRVFAAQPLVGTTYHGQHVAFRLDSSLYFTNDGLPSAVDVDFGDGRGYVPAAFDQDLSVRYRTAGRKTLRFRMTYDGFVLHAQGLFDVERLGTPAPDDTLHITATIPYEGVFGTGDAYVYLSDDNAQLTRPVVVVEGFDRENIMNWEELYTLLNQEELLETIRSLGFDAVVLNFTDATDYIQRNAFVLLELLEQVHDMTGVETTVIGASMGGLVSRYTLAYAEDAGMDASVATWISFDAPQWGASIPLGMQYWLAFFASESEDAAMELATLDTPAARQMLVYHHTDPPGATGESDPLRGELVAELDALGGYPSLPRRVAVANGSGSMEDQGFAAGDQIIRWEYDSFLVDIRGNIWAVPDQTNSVIFYGLIDPLFGGGDEQTVFVVQTSPYDNAPGGSRASMAEMAAIEAPYGDIVALHDSHCFIPTVSALDVDTDDLFYDIAGDADLLEKTPFDAAYFPVENQEHVLITPENAEWFLAEILMGASGVAEGSPPAPSRPALVSVSPNPLTGPGTVRFSMPSPGRVRMDLIDVGGRRALRLGGGVYGEGSHEVELSPERLRPGVYFLRFAARGGSESRKVVIR